MTALDAIGPYEVFNATRAFDIQFAWKEIGPIVTDSGLLIIGATPMPNERIVRSGKIFTAAGVSAGIDLALHLTAELLGPEAAQAAQLSIEYDPQPPFDAGHLSKTDPAVARRARADLAKLAVLNLRNLVSLPEAGSTVLTAT
jgi:hypothetical protein